MRYLRLICLWPFSIFAQPDDLPAGVKLTPATSPPPIVLSRFNAEFPNQQGTWSQRGEAFLVNFQAANHPGAVEYDKTGKRIARYRKITASEAPKEIRQRFGDSVPSELWERNDSLRTTFFTIEKKDTVWYEQQGDKIRR